MAASVSLSNFGVRNMRKHMILAVAAATLLATPAIAETKYSGSWHSIESRSSWSDGKLPKGFSLTIDLKFEDNKLIYHSVNDTDKNAPGSLDYTAPLDGTVAPIAGQARFNQVMVKKLNAAELEILELKDGDVIVGSFWHFLPDGKTFVRHGVGKSPKGASHAFEEYFERR